MTRHWDNSYMGDEIDIKPEEGNTLLLKYRPLGPPEYRDRVRDILVNHRLYAASPRSMNDPFECRVSWSFSAPKETKRCIAADRIRKGNPTISNRELKRTIPGRIQHFEKHGPTQLEQTITDEIGFVSFGGVRDNLLMWAHYAAEHRGVAIEFAASKIDHYEFFGSAMKVNYEEQLPTINAYTEEWQAKVRRFLLTKSKHWDYEREWRILVDNRNVDPFYRFSPDLITAIHLGCRIADDDREFIRQCIKDGGLNASLYQARQSKSAYALKFTKISK